METKLEAFAQSMNDRLNGLQDLLVTKLEKLNNNDNKDDTEGDQTQVHVHVTDGTPVNSSLMPAPKSIIDDTSVQRNYQRDTTSPPIVTVNHAVYSSSQSGVDIDLSQISPSVCGTIISQCLTKGSSSNGRTRSNSRRVQPLQVNDSTTTPVHGRQYSLRSSKNSSAKSNDSRLATSIVTRRSRCKRSRTSSTTISSDEEQCHVTVTMETMDVKKSVRRRSHRATKPTNNQIQSSSRTREENMFLSSPAPAPILRDTTNVNKVLYTCTSITS